MVELTGGDEVSTELDDVLGVVVIGEGSLVVVGGTVVVGIDVGVEDTEEVDEAGGGRT